MDLFSSLSLEDKTKVTNRRQYNEDIQQKIDDGAEYLYPGRRNFFSPVTNYKMMKSQFYEENGERFTPQTVPIDKWEVEMIASREQFPAETLWKNTTRPDRPRRNRNYDDIVKQKEAVKDMLQEDDGSEIFLEESDAFRSLDAIIHYNERKISTNDIIDTFECIATVSDGDDFKKSEIINQLVQIDNVTNNGLYMKNQEMKPFQKEVYDLIMKKIIELDNDGKKFKTTKDELQAQLNFLRKLKERVSGSYERNLEELDFGDIDKGNIYDQLAYMFKTIWDKDLDDKKFEEFEKAIFYFMKMEFKINDRLRVCLIPSGGGKTTLFRRYSKYVYDIDQLLVDFVDKEFLFFIFEYSRIFKRWNVLNQFWKMMIYKNYKKIGNRILLAHSVHQLPACSGLSLMGIIPLRSDDYNVRFFKQNSESIEKELKDMKAQLIRCHVRLMFFEIYKMQKPQLVRNRIGHDWVF